MSVADIWTDEPALSDVTNHVGESRRLKLTRASEISMRATAWLWEPRIPLGALTLIAGREGIGKSTLAYNLVADVTRGRLPGRYFNQPKAVLIVATEDSWSQTIVPRLAAAGADLALVFRLDAIAADGTESSVSMPRDLAQTEALLVREHAGLILLDPLMSRLSDKLDTHKDSDVRQALEPLVAMADRAGCAVVGLIHLSKGQGTDPLTLIMGSRAFAAVARAVLFVMRHPDDEELRIVGQEKNNLGRTDLPDLTFSIESTTVGKERGETITTGRLVWRGESDVSVREALENGHDDADARSVVKEAGDWLTDYLSTQGGAAMCADVMAAGKKAGYAEASIKRARIKMKVESSSHGFPRRTQWSLRGTQVVPAQSDHSSQINHGESDLSDLIDLTEPTGPADSPVGSVGSVGAAPQGECADCGWPVESVGHGEHCLNRGGELAMSAT